ncbi:ParB family protein [Nesterenkonia sp. DZ6]|uniref:ParB family protein n=1 Tax=Nesterenkonia sp. DZ6 TaxID=2901229 RepID=UPI00351D2AE5
MLLWGNQQEEARIRGVCDFVKASDGTPRTVEEFIRSTVMKEVHRLELEHNAGQPFHF